MKPSVAKTVLLIAAVLGILQGLVTFVGGIVSAEDGHKDLKDDKLDYHIPVGKYWCGMFRIMSTSGCDYSKADRGWFKSQYSAIKDGFNYQGTNPDKSNIKKLIGYEAVMAYAFICGLGWILAGVLALVAALKQKKGLALVAGLLFLALYLLFVALFAAVWASVKKVDDDCKSVYDKCPEVKKRITASSREFLGYSICSFILILTSIACCILYAMKAEEESLVAVEKSPIGAVQKEIGQVPIEVKKDQIPVPVQTPAVEEIKKPVQPEKKSEEALSQKFAAQFVKVNKYLVNEQKLLTSSNKKFGVLDKDNSGKVALAELKEFIAAIMAKKNLPPPPEKKVQALLNKYDKDKSGTLEKPEFKNMLYDIFMSSREVLIRKYAESRSAFMKGAKPVPKNVEGAEKMGKLLQDPVAFYKELDAVAHEVDKDKTATLDIDEVTLLIDKFSQKYGLPEMTMEEISKIMSEMGREIKSYSSQDLRMVALAILSIAKNLAM